MVGFDDLKDPFLPKWVNDFNDSITSVLGNVKNVCNCFVQCISHSLPSSAFCFLAGNKMWFIQLNEFMSKLLNDSAYT